MSILELKVTADTTGLLAIKRATDTLRNVLTTSRAANAADINRLTQSFSALDAQAKVATASLTRASAATKANGSAAKVAATQHLALRDATRGVAAAAGSLWMAYGQVLPLLGAYAATAGTLKGIGLAKEFEYQTKYLITVAEATGDFSVSLDEVRSKLLGIRDVADAPSVLAESVKELVKAGFTTTQSISEIENMSRTAMATQEDLSTVTKGVAGQFRAWNAAVVGAERGVSNLTETANMMSYAALATATDFGELNQMLAYTTELGPLTNASFSEILASLGHMTNMGIRGTKAATALRTAMLRLQSPTKGLKDDLANLSVPFTAFSESGEVKDLTTMFEDLNKSLTPLTEESRIRLLTDLFGKRSGKAGVALAQAMSQAINEGKTSFRGLEKAIRDAGYAGEFTQKIFDELADTTQGQTELLKADVIRTFTESYYGANVAVRGLVDSLREAVADGSLQTLIDGAAMLATGLVSVVKYAIEFRGVLLGVASTYAGLKAGAGVLSLVSGIKKATAAAGIFNLVSSANPYVLIASVILGIGVALVAYADSAETVASATKRLGEEAEEAARKADEGWKRAAEGIAASQGGILSTLGGRSKAGLPRPGGPDFSGGWVMQFNQATGEFEKAAELTDEASLTFGRSLQSAREQGSGDESVAGVGTETMRTPEQRAVDEWKTQNDIAVHKRILQARAALDQEALSRKVSLLDAEHKAGLISEKAHLDQVRSLQMSSIDQQIADQRVLIKYAEDQEKEAEAALKTAANEDKLQHNTKLAEATAGVASEMDKLAKLEAQRAHLPKLFASEDIQRAKAFSDSLRSVTDATQDLRDSMEALPQLATMNEGAAAYAEQLAALKKEEARGLRGMANSGSPEEVAQYQAVMAEKLSAAHDYYAAEQVLRTDSLSGAKKAFADYAYAANDSFSQMKGFTSNFFQGIEDAMVKFVQTGKLSFNDLADSIMADLVRIATQGAISGLIDGINWEELLTNTASSTTTAGAKQVKSSKGNVFSSPGLSAYSNSIVTSPTVFPFAKGTGLMGEAGPEAILPLERNSKGQLGVMGGGSNVEIIINNNSSSQATAQESKTASGNRSILVTIGEAISGDIKNGGTVHKAMRDTFGLSPRVGGR